MSCAGGRRSRMPRAAHAARFRGFATRFRVSESETAGLIQGLGASRIREEANPRLRDQHSEEERWLSTR
jgi:hypothetical protein